uniref:Pseudouridine synthase RsuA/RluA-like domain-containing protein n=1 Tax=Tetradesmus obliquus TaxID=3088 RepID=A0A383VHA8_TETOB|eukprot:jgi/Sobl393_1/1578/SZX64189.1
MHRYSTLTRSSSQQASTADSDDEDESEDATPAASSSSSSSSSSDGPTAAAAAKPQPEKPLRVERLLANLGYGKRQECALMLKRRRVVYADSGKPAKVGEKALAGQLLLDGEPLDPAPPLAILLHKPTGYVVTSPEDENVTDPKIYDLLPYRFGRRRPFLSAIGRLDKETSGLLMLTDDGKLLHSIQSPARGIWKLYTATLAAPLTGKEAAAAVRRFGSGTMQLVGDRSPLLPAGLRMLDDVTAEVAICEGRYHQIRRMFASIGREVVALHRNAIGGLALADCGVAEGAWAFATQQQMAAVLAGPDLQEGIQQQQQQQDEAQAGAAAEDEASQQGAAAGISSGRRRKQSAAPAGAGSLQGVKQQQDDAAWFAAGAEASSSSEQISADQLAEESDDADEDDDVELLLDEEQSVRRYTSSSRWQKRRAAIASSLQRRQKQPAECAGGV